jgi:hypothetical protein
VGGGHRREVTHLPEPVRLGIRLDDLDREANELRDRLRSVMVADDPARDAGCPAAHPTLVDEQDGSSRGCQGRRRGEPVDPAADD